MVNGQWVALGSHPSLGLSLLPQNLDVAIVSWCFMTSSSASKARQRRRTIPKGPMTAEIVFRRQRIVIFGKLGIIMCIYIWRTIHFLFGLVGICYEINVLSWPSCRMSAESTLSTIISVGSSGFHQQWRIPQNNKFGGVKNDRPSDFHWNLNWWAATDLTAVDVLPLVNVNHFLRWISRWTYRFDILLTKVSSGWEGAKGVSV